MPQREEIDPRLKDQSRKERFDAIASYAEEMAGTAFDLDKDFESAGIENLLSADQNVGRSSPSRIPGGAKQANNRGRHEKPVDKSDQGE